MTDDSLHLRKNQAPAGTALLLSLVLVFLLLAGCAPKVLKQVPANKLPSFADDLQYRNLEDAVRQSIDYYEKFSPDTSCNYAGTPYSAAWLKDSLLTFLALLQSSSSGEELRQRLADNFVVYKAGGSRSFGHWGDILVTGYFEPLLEGSLDKKPPFVHALYARPADLVAGKNEKGENSLGRLENGRLVPYWTRSEIEENNLLAGQEMVYLADPVEAFILHVQGSGKVRLRDGEIREILFAAKNGRPYRSIGKLLVDEGKMTLAEASMPLIRQYLHDNPDDVKRVLHHNESFVFFRWGDGSGLVGSLGETLTPGRSLAVDQDVYPAGALAWLQTMKPSVNEQGEITGWVPLARFAMLQDSGSAIKGPGRLDLFWGGGDHARVAAGSMKHSGTLYLLVKKPARDPRDK